MQQLWVCGQASCSAAGIAMLCVLCHWWPHGHRGGEGLECVVVGPADQWGGHLCRAGDEGQDGEHMAMLAVCGVVSAGGHEAHFLLEQGQQVQHGQGQHSGAGLV